MLLGAQMYTVRDFCKTAESMKQSLQKVRAIGYRAVQLSAHNWEIPAADIAAWCGELGLKIVCTHLGFDQYANDLPGVIALHKTLGCAYPGVGAMPWEYMKSAEGFERFAQEASCVAQKLAAEGLHFIYHNHHFEFIRFGRLTGMDILLRDTAPEFQFEMDTHWVQAGGGDPAAWIYKLEGRMDVVHFKDMAVVPGERKTTVCEIGEGNLNWDAILQACYDTGVKFALVEQDVSTRDPFESLAMSYDYLAAKGVY